MYPPRNYSLSVRYPPPATQKPFYRRPSTPAGPVSNIMATSSAVYRASTTAPVNIAVVKYWGKRDTVLNLPTNSSLSVTLSQDDLRAHTTATCSESYSPEPDSLVLNGQSEDITASKRTLACLSSLRSLRAELE